MPEAAGEKVTVSAVRSRAGVSMEAARQGVEQWRATSRPPEDRAGLLYPAALHDAEEALPSPRGVGERRPLAATAQIHW